MKHIMTVKFDSAKWRKVDEYKLAAMFIDIGFRQIEDIIELRVFDLLNISRINNNKAEEMLLSTTWQAVSLKSLRSGQSAISR